MTPKEQEPQAWKKVSSRAGGDLKLFRVRHDRLVHPGSNKEFDRLVLETPDWVNVVAITPERHVVLVRQFRFGIGAVTLEVPGGVVDASESIEEAAQRELREETGFTSECWSALGSVYANPAFHDNYCHHWLAEDVRLTRSPEPDEGEELVVEALPFVEVQKKGKT